jgi:hypothetical protein
MALLLVLVGLFSTLAIVSSPLNSQRNSRKGAKGNRHAMPLRST